MADGIVTFCPHFKYLGSWISFSLWDDYNITKRITAANASMGALKIVWEDKYVDEFSKYLLFCAIPCNLLLWGYESWAVRKSLLGALELFLHRSIQKILKITMCQVMDDRIKDSYIRTNFYSIPCIKNQIAVRQLTYIKKIF